MSDSPSQLATSEHLGQGTLDLEISAGVVNDLYLDPRYNVFRISVSGGGSATITGFSGIRPGRRVTLIDSTGTFTLVDGDGRSVLVNRIVTPNNVLDLTPGLDRTIEMVYCENESAGRWFVERQHVADVATSGDYNDLDNLPEIPDELPQLYRFLDTDTSVDNSNSDQQWFPSSGAVSLSADTLYRFWGQIRLSQGTVAHNLHVGFGGTVGVRDISWTSIGSKTTMDANGTGMQQAMRSTTTTVRTTVHNTTGGGLIRVEGILRTSTAGTFIPLFKFSAPPGGTPEALAGTYFELSDMDGYTATSRGTWS